MLTTNEAAELTTNQTVRLELGTKDGAPSMRIGFTDQHLLAHLSALEVWRRYNGRADIENRIKELGAQFGLKACAAAPSGRPRPSGHLRL